MATELTRNRGLLGPGRSRARQLKASSGRLWPSLLGMESSVALDFLSPLPTAGKDRKAGGGEATVESGELFPFHLPI